MKPRELRKKDSEELKKLLKNMEFEYMKSVSSFGRDNIDKKKAGINVKGTTKQGIKTSQQKQMRKNIARIKTILNERNKK